MKRRWFVDGGAVALVVACLAADCTTNGMQPFTPRVWQQLHADASNSGLNTVQSVPASVLNRKWSTFVGLTPMASPVAHPNGNVYIGNINGELVAVRPDGGIALRTRTNHVFFTSPAIDRFGDIYIVGYLVTDTPAPQNTVACTLYRFGPNGNIRSQTSIPNTMASPKIVNDRIFISTPSEIIVLSRSLSIITRQATSPGAICNSSAFATVIDRLFSCIPGDSVCWFGLDPPDFSQPRHPSLALTTDATLTNPDEPLIVVCNYPFLTCFKLVGDVLQTQWVFELDADPCDDNNPEFSSPAIVLGGIVVLGYNTDNLVGFDILTGQRLWSVANAGISGTPAAGLRDVFAATYANVLRVNSAGQVITEASVGAGAYAAPAVTLDHVFVVAEDGLYTYSLLLDPLSIVPVPMSRHSDPLVDGNGNVYVMTESGHLQAYGGTATTAAQLPGVEWVAPTDGATMSYAVGQTLEALFPMPFTGAVGVVSNLDGILCSFDVTEADEAQCDTAAPLRLGTHRLTMHATDADGTQQSAQVLVEVVNTPPIVTITSPAPIDTFSDIDTVPLAASVFDPDEASFVAGSVQWKSNRDGVLGTGLMLSTTLSEGTHTITVRATDEMGALAEASRVLDIVGN